MKKISISHSQRYKPGQDLMTKLVETCSRNKFEATNIQTCVGNVKYCWIKTAGSTNFTLFDQGNYEIVSLVGTIDKDQNTNIHISIADNQGQTFSGHLPSLPERVAQNPQIIYDCPIFTTAEIVLTENVDYTYLRDIDTQTSQKELRILKRNVINKKKFIYEYLGNDEL